MHIRLVFSNFCEYIKEHEYTEDSAVPDISEEEAKAFTDIVLKKLEISDYDIEYFELKRYWKWESDYKAEIECRGDEYPDSEKLLRIADVWQEHGQSLLSTWNMENNNMKYKLYFVFIDL